MPLNKEDTCSGGRHGTSQLIQEHKKCCDLITFYAELLQTQAGVLPNGSQTWWCWVEMGADANRQVPGVLQAAVGLCRAGSEDALPRSQLLLPGKPYQCPRGLGDGREGEQVSSFHFILKRCPSAQRCHVLCRKSSVLMYPMHHRDIQCCKAVMCHF